MSVCAFCFVRPSMCYLCVYIYWSHCAHALNLPQMDWPYNIHTNTAIAMCVYAYLHNEHRSRTLCAHLLLALAFFGKLNANRKIRIVSTALEYWMVYSYEYTHALMYFNFSIQLYVDVFACVLNFYTNKNWKRKRRFGALQNSHIELGTVLVTLMKIKNWRDEKIWNEETECDKFV